MNRRGILSVLSVFIAVFYGCSDSESLIFEKVSSANSGVTFVNQVENTPDFNIQNYLYFYDGGGVAAGDINNDGLPDLFFTSNLGPNKLYLNKGDFQFEDITESAGISHQPESWSTGVSMADVNGDGFLDFYVSHVHYLDKKGHNQLFINQGDGTFLEKAKEYGLDFEGYSTQGLFFDYNLDGKLDLYLLNHSFHNENTYGEADILRAIPDERAGDRLFRNDGDRFTDVTEEAGIFSSALGYGLGIAMSDLNVDGFPDLYVGNDFHEDDYLYLHQGERGLREQSNATGGPFSTVYQERLYDFIGHTSNSSMGNDIADLDNDGLPEIFSLDMMPWDRHVFSTSGSADPVLIYETKKSFGFGEKNNRNTLQHHRGFDERGEPVFAEVAFAKGVARTDWSWSVLMADYDLNGYNDIYVTNGIPARPNDLDYIAALRSLRQSYRGEELKQKQYDLIPFMAQAKVPDVMFANQGAMVFEEKTAAWGLMEASWSNGAAYADLDNDGDLDLVVNRINQEAVIYRNRTLDGDKDKDGNKDGGGDEEKAVPKDASYLMIELSGEGGNRFGVGSKVYAFFGGEVKMREQSPVRGFHSSVDPRLHFGFSRDDVEGLSGELGSHVEPLAIDSLLVVWPDRSYQWLKDVELNQRLTLFESEASGLLEQAMLRRLLHPSETIFERNQVSFEPEYRHRENLFSDFEQEPLLPFRLSTRGPGSSVADLNADGLDDLYLGGAKGQPGRVYLQTSDGHFRASDSTMREVDAGKEDTDALFLDATGDGRLDVIVTSGGFQFEGDPTELTDRLYIHDREGSFSFSINSLPLVGSNTSSVTAADMDLDGDMDLFTGGDTAPWNYGIASESKLLRNNGKGVFELVTEELAPGIETIGMVTDAVWAVKSKESRPELILAGEWMHPIVYAWNQNKFVDVSQEWGLTGYAGLWQALEVADVTGNGHLDLIAGNFGLNTRMKASREYPMRMYTGDFAKTGLKVPFVTQTDRSGEYPFDHTDEILGALSWLRFEYPTARSFATTPFPELFEDEFVDSAIVQTITELRSMLFLNDGKTYRAIPLPDEAQTFPVQAIVTGDFNNDGLIDIVLGGNRVDLKPTYGGKQDAGLGLLLLNRANGQFEAVPPARSGLFVKGEIRNLHVVRSPGETDRLLIVRNNDTPIMYSYRTDQVQE